MLPKTLYITLIVSFILITGCTSVQPIVVDVTPTPVTVVPTFLVTQTPTETVGPVPTKDIGVRFNITTV
jgi:hypothetical protein